MELPPIDWSADRRHTPTSHRPLKKAFRRAEALNRIYSTDKAEPCHYTYFVENHLLWLPLVTAVARVIGAERDQSKMSSKFQARGREFNATEKIVQTALRIMQQSDASQMKSRVREKVRRLDVAMRSRQRIPASCLGKRKDRDEYHLSSGTELGASNFSTTSVQDMLGLGEAGDRLVWRPKAS